MRFKLLKDKSLIKQLGFVFIIAFLLAGCESPYRSDDDGLVNIIPTKEKDSGPSEPVDVSHVAEVVPKWEPRTRAGNKSPYKVKGIVYHVRQSGEGYQEEGIASWYGRKFHGNTTSNGEIYDMFGMTGAHKTLPIPAYVKVENLENNKSIIVRINDRGPFAPGRIIDLSYAGAKKLGYLDAGTARVRVTYIDVSKRMTSANTTQSVSVSEQKTTSQPTNISKPRAAMQLYLQTGAFSQYAAAQQEQAEIAQHTTWPVVIESARGDADQTIHRVQIGPLPNMNALELLQGILLEQARPTVRVFR